MVANTRKGSGSLIGVGADGDLPLLHGLQQRALHLGWRTVDLVGEDEVAEQRSFLHRELLAALAVDHGSDQVGREQVRRELDAAEAHVHGLGKGFDGDRLRQAGHAFQHTWPSASKATSSFCTMSFCPRSPSPSSRSIRSTKALALGCVR
jgi:hypothetical protein